MSFSPSIWGRPFGPALCFNLWLFEFFCLWLMFQTTEVHGCYGGVLQPFKYRNIWRLDSNILSSMDVEIIMTWNGLCMECKTPNISRVGLLCSNFLRLIKTFILCFAVWCRECYRPHLEVPFRLQRSLAARDDGREYL